MPSGGEVGWVERLPVTVGDGGGGDDDDDGGSGAHGGNARSAVTSSSACFHTTANLGLMLATPLLDLAG